MSNHLNRTYAKITKRLGIIGGMQFSIIRPDYTAMNQAGTVIYAAKSIRMDPSGKRFSETAASEGLYYDVFLDRNIIQPGDILTPTIPDGMTPTVTILHFMPMKACVAVKTSRIGSITKDINTTIYSNIRYSFHVDSFPGTALNEKIEGSLGVPTRKAIIYKREGIFKGMRLIETGNTTAQFRWIITNVIPHQDIMILTLEEDRKS